MNPTELLAERHRDYAKAQDRQARAVQRQQVAQEQVQALERELVDAEDEDRQALGEALVDGTQPPAGKAEKARSALTKAKAELEALQYACERASQALAAMPAERRSDWLPKAGNDFQAARKHYEDLLGLLAEAREKLTQEAALVSFLNDGQTWSVQMGPSLRVHATGVEGLSNDVAVTDVLRALKDELAELEFDAIRAARK